MAARVRSAPSLAGEVGRLRRLRYPGIIAGRFQHWPIRVFAAYMFRAQGAFVGGFALLHSPTLAAATLLVGGVAIGTGNALTLAMMQHRFPAQVRGRVFDLTMTRFGVATRLGAVGGGALLPILPLWWVWALGSLTSLAVAVGMTRWIPLTLDGQAADSARASVEPPPGQRTVPTGPVAT